MIFGNIKDVEEYGFLEENVLKCLEYAKNNELVDFEKGSHEIEGDNLFVNIVEYETTTLENRIWEAHRQYLDLHLMLKGTEEIDVNFIDNMVQKEFVEKDDFLPLEGEKNSPGLWKKQRRSLKFTGKSISRKESAFPQPEW